MRLLVAEVGLFRRIQELRNVVGAGLSAYVAADAFCLVDEHFAARTLGDGLDRADLHEGGSS